MSEINTYYQEIIAKVKKLIEDKRFDEAIFILEDELEAPYVPVEFQAIMEELLMSATVDKNYFQGLSQIENFNQQQLLSSIFEKNTLNSSALLLYFERYHNILNDDDFCVFENIFVNRITENDDKILLFETLSFYKINYNFRFFNKHFKEEYQINPTTTLIFEQIDLYKNSKNLINELAIKEPSILNFCYNILLTIYKYYFPTIPDFDYKELASSIFNYMINTLQGELITENKITKLINEIIAHK